MEGNRESDAQLLRRMQLGDDKAGHLDSTHGAD